MSARVYLPVALNLEGRSAVIVGGGEAAYFKASYLSDFSLPTTVLAPPNTEFDVRLEEYQRDGWITLLRKPYEPERLDGHWLAVICTGDRDLDYAIERDARQRQMLVNVVDDPNHCDFFASGYVRRGPVSIAINTGGVSPGFSAALKERVAELFGPELEEHLRHYTAWRELVRSRIDEFPERERLWRELRAAGLYRVLQAEGPEAARALVEARLLAFRHDSTASPGSASAATPTSAS